MKPSTLFPALVFLLCSNATADTVVEFKYQNARSQLLTNGKMARINTRGTDDYMLVNFDNNDVYSVTPGNKQIFNVSDSMPSISGILSPQIRIKLKPLGKGPAVAGYPTTRYRLSANGDYCGSIYASREALQGSDVESVLDSIKAMADNHRQSLGGFAALVPVCQMAQIGLADKLHKIGAPMRVVDKEGRTESEITKILKNARVESHYYTYPANYKSVSITDKLEDLLKQSLQSDSTQKKEVDRKRMKQTRSQLPPQAMDERWRYPDGARYR